MRAACMYWPDGFGGTRKKCGAPANETGHGIFLCMACEDQLLLVLTRRAKDREEADKMIAALAQSQAGMNMPRPSVYRARGGEVSGGRFEENRRKH